MLPYKFIICNLVVVKHFQTLKSEFKFSYSFHNVNLVKFICPVLTEMFHPKETHTLI